MSGGDVSIAITDGRPSTLSLWAVVTATSSVALVALLRWLLHPVLQEGVPYTMFLASVAFSTHRVGVRWGAIVTVMSIVVATHLFVSPWSALEVELAPPAIGSLVVFVASACLVMWIIAREAAATRRAEDRERLLRSSRAERAALERQLGEARRMECVGRLAAGVAHDFNNLTTVILGSADLLRASVPDSPLIDAITLAATRSSEITKQLLGLGQRQMMVLQTVSVISVAEETVQLCERLLPANVSLRTSLHGDTWPIRADTTLVQQIMLNLLTNARDAMPQGGVVSLETENVTIDDCFALQHPEVKPGDYVRLRIADSGIGMDAGTKERIFEPFFTAKKSGTGLGLAVVYGLVMQLGGTIQIESELGKGSRFDVLLPRVHEQLSVAPPPLEGGTTRERNLRVLLVEDNELVRGVLDRMLRGLGHDAALAEDGEKALERAREEGAPQVLVTDIGMPGIDGYQVAEHLRRLFPAIGVVLISGYDDNERLQRVRAESEYVFLRKPFAATQLDQALTQAVAQTNTRARRVARMFGAVS
jgi:two-component system cell cycle sensor histidine kinase/response regulator CckA